MALILKYPLAADTNEKKLAYCHRIQEHNRLLHNFFGKWLRDGLTLTQYNDGVAATDLAGKGADFVLPADMKTKYPYKAQTIQSEFKTQHDDEWNRLWKYIEGDFSQLTQLVRDDTTYDGDIDLDDV